MAGVNLHEIAAAFALEGEVLDVRPLGGGLINDTYVVTTKGEHARRAVLQRLNPRVFPHPEAVMENLRMLLEEAARARPAGGGLRFPAIYPTRAGGDLVRDADGAAWRAMSFLEGTRTFDRPRDPAQAGAAGRALGLFHMLAGGIDPAHMHDTRPDFHHTPRHIARLEAALAGAVPERRQDPRVERLLAFVDERKTGAGAIEAALESGRVVAQVVHGDPKIENFLFSEDGRTAVALIDLDTVKPGTVHHDIADCLRSCCNPAGESGTQPDAPRFDVRMCRALLEGYAGTAGDILRTIEPAHLYEAIRLIPFELGVRFLADYLAGDRYFRIAFPEQNLHRATVQFGLAADIEHQRAAVEEIARESARKA